MKDYSKIIETERLILRKFHINDKNDVYNNYASRDNVTKYLSWSTHKSVDETEAYLMGIVLPDYENEYTYRWAIELKSNHQVIGVIDVVRKDLNKKSVEIGYALGDDYWGQGIMPEAGKAVVKYLFEEGFKRICAIHNVDNPKSGRVMQKIGMSHEGTLRKYSLNNQNVLVDCELFAIVAD